MGSALEARILWVERKISEILAALAALLARLAADEQLLQALASQTGGGGNSGTGTVVAAELTASLTAGSIGSPSSAAGTLLLISGSGYTATGGTTITIYSAFATAITVSGTKFCWITQRVDGAWFLVVADC